MEAVTAGSDVRSIDTILTPGQAKAVENVISATTTDYERTYARFTGAVDGLRAAIDDGDFEEAAHLAADLSLGLAGLAVCQAIADGDQSVESPS